MIDISEIEKSIRAEVEAKVKQELEKLDVSNSVANNLKSISQEKVNLLVTDAVNRLVSSGSLSAMINEKIVNDLQGSLEKEIIAKAAGIIARTDLGSIISQKIEEFISSRAMTSSLPDGIIPINSVNLKGLRIAPESITEGKFAKFSSTGIQDSSDRVVLTLNSDEIVMSAPIKTDHMRVTETLSVESIDVRRELKVSGNVIITNEGFTSTINSMIDNKIAAAKTDQSLDILGNALYANGVEILTHNTLGAGVAYSNLRKVGNLVELNVIDNLAVGESLYVSNGRIGINTQNPAGALTVWDEDAELSIKKLKSKTTFIGTSRDCDLVIGTNDIPHIQITKEGKVSVNELTIGNIRISVAEMVPERDGVTGEIVIMSNAMADQPWAYQCMGGKVWTALFR